jgi:transcriptional regulator with GAF, ATPase, and Fis domain
VIPTSTMNNLQNYSWPGNVRELENVIERAVIINQDEKLRVEIPDIPDVSMYDGEMLSEVEKKHITRILEKTRWKIEGRNGASGRLGLKPSTLRDRMNKLGIKRTEI